MSDLDDTLARVRTAGCLVRLIMLPFVLVGQIIHLALMVIAIPFIAIAAIFGKKE